MFPNIAQVMPLITKFLSNPVEGFIDLEKKAMPYWSQLEAAAGAPVFFLLSKNKTSEFVTVSLFKAANPENPTFWKAYTIPQLFEEFKNLKNLLNTDDTIELTPGSSPAELTSGSDTAESGQPPAAEPAASGTEPGPGTE